MKHSRRSASPPSSGRLVPWTTAEDEALRKLVALHGPKKWSLIASGLPNKGSKQCRRRWQNYLNNTDAKSGGWTADEDALLLEGHAQWGNRWTEIAKMVVGRTDNAVKNRHAVLVKKQQMEEQGLLDIKPAAKASKSASKKRKQSTGGVGPSPKLPPVRTAPPKAGAGAAAAAYGGPAKKQKLSVRVPGRGTGDLIGHHHAPLPPAPLTFGPLDPLLSPSEMQLFNEVNALLTPTQGGLGGTDWDLLGGLASARGGGTRLGSGGASTAPLTDTPLGQWDMASVFSWFLNGTPTAGGTATTAGPSTAATAPSGDARSGPTPRGPTAAAAAQAMAQPSAQSVAAMIRALSPAVSPSVTPRGGGPAAAGSAAAAAAAAASALMPAPPSRRAAATAGAAAAGSGASSSTGAARGQMPDGLTAEMGQRVLLQKLLHLRASGGASAVGGAGGGAGVPLTPFTAAMTEHVFSPLGSRRSPRMAHVRTGGEGATPMVGAAAVSPTFTPSELQLLLSTLGGDNPFAPGIAHDKVAEAQAAAAEELAEGGRRSARAPK